MDDMNEIENKMMIAAQDDGVRSVAPSTPSAPVTVALEETAARIVGKAQERIDSKKLVEKHARALAKNADERIANEIDRQNVENEKKRANNVIDRKELANKLYVIKQESKRLKKEQKHLTKMQKAAQKLEKRRSYWEAHKNTLEQYNMHEGSSRIACTILLWLDGVKCFFIGLSKVSDAIIKALKYILIFGGITAVLMIIPATRNWLLSLLGFIKK